MINKFFTKTFTKSRQSDYVDGKSSKSDVGTFKGHIQQPDPTLIENLGLSFTNTFILWCAIDTDIEVGDSLIDADNMTYSIRSINKRDYGRNQHLEIFIDRDEEYSSV